MNKKLAWAIVGALALAGCGEEKGEATSAKVQRVLAMGDSLSDTGTFGFTFTVQGTPGPVIWVDRIAAQYGLPQLCNFYAPTLAVNSQVGCTNLSVGGGRVNNPDNLTNARSIIKQITDAAAAINYKPTDLVLVDGGGNDAADLIDAFIRFSLNAPTVAPKRSYVQWLGDFNISAPISANDAAAKLVQYMAADGQKLAAAVQADIVNQGAGRVAILNVPGVQNTPLLKDQLQIVKGQLTFGLQQPPTSLSAAAAAAQAQATVDNFSALAVQGVNAFNGALATAFAGSNQVVVVDFNTEFNVQIANPAQFALTNVTTPLCPNNGNGINGPNTCTTATFAGNAPVGADPSTWWQSYAFSDGFHPTPYGHQLIGQVVSRELVRKGWL